MKCPQTQKVAQWLLGAGEGTDPFWGGENVLELDSGDSQHCECAESHLTEHTRTVKRTIR